MADGGQRDQIHNHYESSNEYLYYRQPIVKYIHPHSGHHEGGTPILIEGAFFFNDLRHACTPKCKFGDKIVEAEYISTVRIKCITPASAHSTIESLSVTMNGENDVEMDSAHTFTFWKEPNVTKIEPTSGPSTGGTVVVVYGKDFMDLSRYPDEFQCAFRPEDLKKKPRYTPAKYINSSAIACTTPGGWDAGEIAHVEISYNGIESSKSGHQFIFYSIDYIKPLSGPSRGDPDHTIAIKGDGFVLAKGKASCMIDGIYYDAVSANSSIIECPIPPSQENPDKYRRADFLYSFNGEKYITVLDGFYYYPQVEVTNVHPKEMPASGGRVTVEGKRFKSDFSNAAPACKIGNTVAKAVIESETKLHCDFDDIEIDGQYNQTVLVALNSVSWTPIDLKEAAIHVYEVKSLKPHSGIAEGGTTVHVYGGGYLDKYDPVCRFGIPGKAYTTTGKRVSSHEILCTAPKVSVPSGADYPYEIPFALTFDDGYNDQWSLTGLTYYYYRQPGLLDITPTSVLADQTTLVKIKSTNELPFAKDVIGGYVTNDERVLVSEISCKFGDFGTTKAVLVDMNTIACPSPNTNLLLSDISEEIVYVEVAINGQDYASGSLAFKFLGSRSDSSNGFAWVIGIIIGALILVGLFYLISQMRSDPRKLLEMFGDSRQNDPNQRGPGV